MKSFLRIGALALASLFAAACEDITNPIEEFGTLEDPFVRFEFPSAVGFPGVTVPVLFVMTTAVEETVNVQYSFAGDAVYGTDFWAVDEQGNRRNDVTASGGTAQLVVTADRTTFPRDTLWLFIPSSASNGRTARIELTSAATESGRTVDTGFIDRYRVFELSIRVIDITGDYTGQHTGVFGSGGAAATIRKPAAPIVVQGTEYEYEISDYTGVQLFAVPVAWAFNVTPSGQVIAPSQSHVVFSDGQGGTIVITSNVTGTYDFDALRLVLNVEVTCCGGEGGTYTLTLTKQP